jgi:hypothetical protein
MARGFIVHAARHQTRDVDRTVALDTQEIGFASRYQHGAAFAAVTRGGLDLLLSGPRSTGARSRQDGRVQVPGGCGIAFWSGIGGRQIQALDADGNPIGLFEAAAPA